MKVFWIVTADSKVLDLEHKIDRPGFVSYSDMNRLEERLKAMEIPFIGICSTKPSEEEISIWS